MPSLRFTHRDIVAGLYVGNPRNVSAERLYQYDASGAASLRLRQRSGSLLLSDYVHRFFIPPHSCDLASCKPQLSFKARLITHTERTLIPQGLTQAAASSRASLGRPQAPFQQPPSIASLSVATVCRILIFSLTTHVVVAHTHLGALGNTSHFKFRHACQMPFPQGSNPPWARLSTTHGPQSSSLVSSLS
jgi:hypothetical protein